jgi:hypothetical protein
VKVEVERKEEEMEMNKSIKMRKCNYGTKKKDLECFFLAFDHKYLMARFTCSFELNGKSYEIKWRKVNGKWQNINLMAQCLPSFVLFNAKKRRCWHLGRS